MPAVAFDLDDTLCDWATGIDGALAAVTDPETAQRFRDAVAEHAWLRRDGIVVSRRHWMTVRDPQRFWREAADPDSDIEQLCRAYRDHLSWPLYDDVIATLDELAGGTRLALLSNAPTALERAAAAGILGYFEVALTAPDDRKKPHPDAFDALLDALALPASEVVYVGDDAEEDVEGALAHGMHAVWLDRHHTGWQPPDGALTITSLRELHVVLASLARE
jgi:2-haloalkanoic acid dehalogenase type II